MTYNEIKNESEELLNDIIKDILEYDYSDNMDQDDVYDLVTERIHEVIDGHEWVIYTHRSKELVDVLDIDIFGDDEMTGERYTSWNQAAYCGLYNVMIEENNIIEMIEDAIEEL